jgi:GAF domain-containing protein/pyridoxamine 5'-phosphate oxidase-like protein
VSTTQTLSVPLEEIETCFEGVIPSPFCTCSAGGMPNITYLSVVHRVDSNHVALSFQFFNKSRKNLLENPRAQVLLVEPPTFRQFQLDLIYQTTLTEGPIFERLRVNLDAVASQVGMSHVFSLRGADIFQVLSCRAVAGNFPAEAQQPLTDHLRGLDALTESLTACKDLDTLLTASLEGLSSLFGYDHSFVLVPDEEEKRLFTIASRGFPVSGVGSEVAIGEGIIGIAAAQRSPIRNANLARDMIYSRLVRTGVENLGDEASLQREIPLPGLANAQSQLILPLVVRDRLLGVLCLQGQTPGRFRVTDERVLQVAARHLAVAMANLRSTVPSTQEVALLRKELLSQESSVVKYYKSDDSIFIDDAYLIKGIPGRLLWKLLQAFVDTGRVAFSNKEIRLDAGMRLPDIKDNLETRLILLRRRLDERCEFVRLVHAGRGQLHLEVQRKLRLKELA